MKKYALLLVCLFSLTSTVYAQVFEVPLNYAFQTREDYAKYQNDIIEAATWLENTPLNQETEKRKEVNTFLFQWLSGSPDVTVELQEYVSTFSEKNPDLLIVFLGGWAKYQLKNPAEKDAIKLHIAGIESVLSAYERGGAVKDKQVEKLIKTRDKQKLESWLRKRLS